jgi:hypothetical protein
MMVYNIQNYWVSGPEDGSRPSYRSVALWYFEFWMMDKVQKQNNSECYITSDPLLRLDFLRDPKEQVSLSPHLRMERNQVSKMLCFLVLRMDKVQYHPPYSPDLVPCDFWLLPKL